MSIINQNMQPAQAAPAQQPAPQQDNVVQRIVMAAMQALNQDAVEQNVLQLVQSGATPAQGLAQAMLAVLQALQQQSKGGMPEQAIAAAAQQILELIVQMCQAAKILPPQLPPQLIEQAKSAAVQLLDSGQPQGQGQPAPQAATQPGA